MPGLEEASHGMLLRLVPAAGLASALAVLLAKVQSARLLSVNLAILALRATTPISIIFVLRKLYYMRYRGNWHIHRVLRYCLTGYFFSEAFFWLYILEYKRRLNNQTTRRWQAVPVHSTPEKRQRSMERYLLSLTQVSKITDDSGSKRAASSTTGGLRRSGGVAGSVGGRLQKLSDDSLLSRVTSFSSNSSLFGGGGRTPKHEESVADLLKLWEGQENVSDEDLQRLKWLELAAFFTGPGRGDCEDVGQWLRRGNMEEWIAHYWFRGATPEELDNRRGERQELRNLVDIVLKDAGLEHMASGYNPKVMRLMGFHRERVGGLAYWKRDPRRDVPTDVDLNGGSQTPMVFVHGLGVGLVPYYLLIHRLSRRHSGDFLIPEFPCLAMAPWESVPSAREVVAQLQDMLAANGHTAAHFVGHSFGSLVIGWVLKMSPSSVLYTTLMEPAQFLMMKSECLCKVLYGPPATCFEALVRYLAFRELFTVNLICRNFFWEQSTMWPEDICVPALICLAGSDHIVQSIFVRRMLEHERQARKKRQKSRRKTVVSTASGADVRVDVLAASQNSKSTPPEVLDVHWFDGFLHGEILVRPKAQDKLFTKMRQMRAQADKDRENR